jgi:DNA-binding CsgD family transcriptional regulator
MTEDAALRLAEIADTPARMPERGGALLVELRRHVPFDSAWIALAKPFGNGFASLASTSMDDGPVQYLSGPTAAHEIEVAGANRPSPPLSLSDLPYPADAMQTWAESLLPAGYREALSVALYAPGRRFVGFLALLSGSAQPPPTAVRRRLGQLVPSLAHAIDPIRSLVTAALLVRHARAGVVLLPHNRIGHVPGLGGDVLLAANSLVLDAARATLSDGQVYASFLWPRGGRHAPDGHVRVTVISSTDDVRAVVTGVVLLSPAGPLRGLTPRELEVLGLLVVGCSNQEIARELVVATRTVAAHLEHILVKLQASSRTLAAVRAEREGLYVPAVRPLRAQ